MWVDSDTTTKPEMRSPRCFIKQVHNENRCNLHHPLALLPALFLPLYFLVNPLDGHKVIYFTPLTATTASEPKFRRQAQSITLCHHICRNNGRSNFTAQRTLTQRALSCEWGFTLTWAKMCCNMLCHVWKCKNRVLRKAAEGRVMKKGGLHM